MLTLRQHRLLKLAEECDEVGQRCSKQMLFGNDEVQPGQDLPNHERLRGEVLDVLVTLELCYEMRILRPISPEDVARHRAALEPKIERMMALARAKGCLEPP